MYPSEDARRMSDLCDAKSRALSRPLRVAVQLFCLWCGSLLVLLLFSTALSPLFPFSCSEDAPIFLLIGKGIAQGQLPYRELFDHKGPLLFYLNAWGYGLGGVGGMLCLEAGSLALFLFEMAKLLRYQGYRPVQQLPALLTGLLFVLISMGTGDYSEEYALPLLMLPLLLASRRCSTGRGGRRALCIVTGLCIGALAFSRLNNAVAPLAASLYLSLHLLRQRRFATLAKAVAYTGLGFAVVATPLCLWFAAQGALGDMLYGTFLHNLRYAAGRDLSFEPLQALLLVLCVFFFLCQCRARDDNPLQRHLLLAAGGATLLMLCAVHRYAHYFLLYTPFIILGASALHSPVKHEKARLLCRSVALVCVVVLAALAAERLVLSAQENLPGSAQRAACLTVTNQLDAIPEAQRRDTLGYETPAAYYLWGNLLPNQRCFTLQHWYAKSNPQLMAEFRTNLLRRKPRWLFTVPEAPSDKVLEHVLRQDYQLVSSTQYCLLYRRS